MSKSFNNQCTIDLHVVQIVMFVKMINYSKLKQTELV